MPLSLRNHLTIEHLSVCFIFLLTYISYLFTLPVTVALEDDGLFLMSSYYTGISHPPGYPLYSLVSWFFGAIPVGSYAFRIHAMSAFFAAGTCGLLYVFIRQLNLPCLVAAAAGLAFAYSKSFWSQAIIAEVYSLNAFLVFAMFVLGLSVFKSFFSVNKHGADNFVSTVSDNNVSILYWGAFIYGLSLTVHVPLVVLSTPSLLILLFPVRQQIINHFPKLLCLFLLGLSPYLWMIWRSNTDVLINFIGEIKTFSDLSFIFSRDGYVQVDISRTAGLSDKLNYLSFLLNEIYNQFTWLGFIFVILGFAYQWIKWNLRICFSLLLLFLFNSFFFLFVIYFDYDYLSRYVFGVYPLLAYAVMSIWLALGIHIMSDYAARFLKNSQYQKYAVILVTAIIVSSIFYKNISFNNRHDYKWANDYAHNLFRPLPEDANLFVSGDIHTFVLGYMHYVEELREDIEIYSLQGLVFSNRLFHPSKTKENEKLDVLESFVKSSPTPVCTSDAIHSEQSHVDYWLFSCFSNDAEKKYDVELDSTTLEYFRNIVADESETDPWTIHHRQQLIKKMGTTLGKVFVNNLTDKIDDYQDYVSIVTSNYYGALGYLEGINVYPLMAKDVNEMIRVIKAINMIPELAKKHDKASFYEIRGDISFLAGNTENTVKEYQTSIDIWPDQKNLSIKKLMGLYKKENKRAEYTKLRLKFFTNL